MRLLQQLNEQTYLMDSVTNSQTNFVQCSLSLFVAYCHTLICRRYSGVHQCSSNICINYCTTLHIVRRAYWCLDEQQPAEDEYRQNSPVVAWN